VGECRGGVTPLQGPRGAILSAGGSRGKRTPIGVRGRSPRRKNYLVNVYCNFIVNTVKNSMKCIQKEFFYLLNEIKRNGGDQLKLGIYMGNIKDKYQKAQNAYDKIIEWKDVYDNPPSTMLVYTSKENIKDQVLLDTWNPIVNDIKSTQEAVTKHAKYYGEPLIAYWKNLEWI
jgi:hypothetical protein